MRSGIGIKPINPGVQDFVKLREEDYLHLMARMCLSNARVCN